MQSYLHLPPLEVSLIPRSVPSLNAFTSTLNPNATNMPHAVLKVNNLTGIVVSDFHLSAPTELVDRVMSMISSAGLHPQAQAQEGSEVGHVKIEGEFSLFGGVGGSDEYYI